MKITKYIKYYKIAKDREDFIKLVLKDFPKLKISSIKRRWYDYKPKILIEHIYPDNEKQIVTGAKLLTIKDMVNYKIKFNRPYLNKYGYNNAEINWLIDNKIIKLENENM